MSTSSPPHVIVRPTPRRVRAKETDVFVTNVNVDPKEEQGGIEEALRKANYLPSVKAALETMTIYDDHEINHTKIAKNCSTNSVSNEEPSKFGNHNQNRASNDNDLSPADEFVWLDTHNRLVELQQVPWTVHHLEKLVKHQFTSSFKQLSSDLMPRLSYYLQRVLVRVAREIQRLSHLGYCGQAEVQTALRLVLSPTLALNAYSAVMRALGVYNVAANQRRHKGERAGIVGLDVGKMHKWMVDLNLANVVDDLAAVALTAGIASVTSTLVELLLQSSSSLSSGSLESLVSSSSDVFGLMQPVSHLSSSRVAGGGLVLSPVLEALVARNAQLRMRSKESNGIRQVLLTTCVGSALELREMVHLTEDYCHKMWHSAITNSPVDLLVLQAAQKTHGKAKFGTEAIESLFYFMRCSQLQHAAQDHQAPIQELVYERPYMVLPPVLEWVRASISFAQHLRSPVTVEAEDVQQAARLLLPGVDCPPPSFLGTKVDHEEEGTRLRMEMVLQLAISGNNELLRMAKNIVPSIEKVRNRQGFNALQLAVLKGDLNALTILIENGVKFTNEVVNNDSILASWSPMALAALKGNVRLVSKLLETNLDEHSPSGLQVASAAGHVGVVELLLANDADPFRCEKQEESSNLSLKMNFNANLAQNSALALAAMNGRKSILFMLVQHALKSDEKQGQHRHKRLDGDEVLSLHEILAETLDDSSDNETNDKSGSAPKWNVNQRKTLQSAMYHAAESHRVDLALNLRNLGVNFTLATWLRCLALVMERNSDMFNVEELLQDFDSKWIVQQPEQIINEALNLLFKLLHQNRHNDATLILIADIFAACLNAAETDEDNELLITNNSYSNTREGANNAMNSAKSATMSTEMMSSAMSKRSASPSGSEMSSSLSRIDPKFVNNSELSDVHFIVENRVFYAHKLVLVSASARFKALVESSNSSVLHIHDIRYDVFAHLMNFVYGNEFSSDLSSKETLDLLAAANYFELIDLQRHCEKLAANFVELDTVMVFLVHAKVYEAQRLLHFCHRFVLRNLAALFTFDEGVKRLLFSRNHDTINDLKTLLIDAMSRKFELQLQSDRH